MSRSFAARLLGEGSSGTRLDDLKLEVNLFASCDRIQVLLPELADESHRREALIHVDQQLQPGQLPEVQYRHSGSALDEPNICIERKDCAVVGQVPKRIAVQMIAMSQVGREVRICPVRRYELHDSTCSSNAV